MIYLLHFLLILIYYSLIVGGDFRNKQKIKKFSILLCIHVVLFRALANPFNYVDADAYDIGFLNIRDLSFTEAVLKINTYTPWGQVYVFINWLVGQFTKDYQILYVVLAVLSVAPVIWYHYKVSHIMLISITIYLMYPMMYYMGFGVLRQHLAAGFVLLALYFVEDYKKSIPLAIFATLCHTSAIVFFPYYFFRRLNKNGNSGFKMFVITLLAYGVAAFFLAVLIGLFVRSEVAGKEGGNNNSLPLIILGSIAILSFYTKVYNSQESHDKDVMTFVLYGIALSLLSLGRQGFGRLTLFNMYLFPIALTLLFKYSKPSFKPILYFYTISVYIFIITQLKADDYTYIPFWTNI